MDSISIADGRADDGNPMQLSGEDYAAGIMNLGSDLTLRDCLIIGNHAAGGGGGIFNNAGATLTVEDTTIVGNSAEGGGGLSNSGLASFTGCTFDRNTATKHGGGIINSNLVVLNNCSLFGNSAMSGGGIRNNFGFDTLGDVMLHHCTLSGNTATEVGGGISVYPGIIIGGGEIMTTVVNSIVAGNSASWDPNISGSANLTSSFTSGDPMLAPAGVHGGPTKTMPPRAGSPVVDAATGASSVTADQRGLPRALGTAPDIGAVERQSFPILFPGLTPGGDENANGRSNFFEYAAGFDPAAAGTPVLGPLIDGQQTYVHPVRVAADDVVVTYEYSATPGALNWEPLLESTHFAFFGAGPGVGRIRLEDSFTSDKPALLLRHVFSPVVP
jgi:hypothetical protein